MLTPPITSLEILTMSLRFRHHSPRVVSLCMVSCLTFLYACEQQKKLSSPTDAMPTTPPTTNSASHDPAQADQGTPAQPSANDSLAAQMAASEGKSCLVDKNCAGYLRCISDVCTNPDRKSVV